MTVSHVAGSTGCDQKPAENGRREISTARRSPGGESNALSRDRCAREDPEEPALSRSECAIPINPLELPRDLLRRVHTVARLLCTAQAQRERPHRYDAELFSAAGLRDVGTCWVGMRSASIPWPHDSASPGGGEAAR